MRDSLKHIVDKLAVKGFRKAGGDSWNDAMKIMHQLITHYCCKPTASVWEDEHGTQYTNFSLFFKGKIHKKIVIGAHYDTYEDTPGADDNASAVAVLLGLSSKLRDIENLPYDTELVFYACEEPPFFGTDAMGSFKHAIACSPGNTNLMICLEMVGFYSNELGSQKYPFSIFNLLYGKKANYLMLVSNFKSRRVLRPLRNVFKESSMIYKSFISPFKSFGMDWSDHRNYWSKNIPAIMITDTSVFRNSNYHQLTDTPNTLDYDKMAILTQDLFKLVKNIELN